MSMQQKQSWLDRPVVKGIGLTWEQGLYIIIVVVCLVSRLAMLGYRVQTHDESLHTKHSWDLYIGNGFIHNPMMHGPFLFHITAFSYFLFGDNDFSARLPVALMGTLLVALPYLLRRYLGRKGALAASLLFLISPSITYYSRYIRMDIPAILFSMVVIWAMFRYLEEGKGKHLYILAGALSLLYATKEVAPIYTMIIAIFLAGLFVIRALMRPWRRRQAEVVFTVALVAAMVGLVVLAIGWLARAPVEPLAATEMAAADTVAAEEPGLPIWGQAGGILAVLSLLVAAGSLLYGMWGQLRTFRSFDLIVLIGTLSLPFASPLPISLLSRLASRVVAGYSDPSLVPTLWSNLAVLRPLNYHAPDIYYSGAVLALVVLAAIAIGLIWNWRRWSIAAAIHTAIFLLLFTTVFTNGAGIASGWVGSVGYWLEQQGVERGGQPWFYYFVVLPMYDFLPLLGALVAPVYLAIRGLVRLIRPPEKTQNPSTIQLPGTKSLFIPWVLIWALLAWIGYSYAGERMAWLTLHIATPMILLTGWLLGRLLEAIDWQKVGKQQGWLLILLLPALIAALASFLTAAGQTPFQGVEYNQLLITGTFLGGLAGAAFLGIIVALLWARVGLRDGLLLASLTIFLVLGLLTIRVAYRFSFINFDRPAEFLVYAHEGPDVRTTMEQLEELSLRVGGGERLIDVTYGPEGSWPFYWYMRNYPNSRFYGEQPTRDQVLATAIIAGQPQWPVVEPYLEDDYYTFDYFFLWWPIEDYRQLTLEKLWDWLTDPQKRAALWQIFYNMDYTLYDEVTSGRRTPDNWPLHRPYRLYIRKDVADRVWNFGIGPSAEPSPPEPDPYEENWQPLTAQRVLGAEGNGPGLFSWPRGIAVSDDGFIYVADSQNHRIQKISIDGGFVTAWGSFGDCANNLDPAPGTFCEPWDVAVGPDGSVYVADTWAHRIQKFTADGEFVTTWGVFGQFSAGDPAGEGAFYGPRSVAVGPDGMVFVCDTGNKRVQVFTDNGLFVREWGGGGASLGQLNEPVGLALSPDGLVYVADSWNLRVQAIDSNGIPVASWPINGWNNPTVDEKPYLATDDNGRVYVSDPGHYRILVFDANGQHLYSFGQFGFDNTSLAMPMGIATGPDGALYVSDASSHRIVIFDLPE